MESNDETENNIELDFELSHSQFLSIITYSNVNGYKTKNKHIKAKHYFLDYKIPILVYGDKNYISTYDIINATRYRLNIKDNIVRSELQTFYRNYPSAVIKINKHIIINEELRYHLSSNAGSNLIHYETFKKEESSLSRRLKELSIEVDVHKIIQFN